MKKLLVPFMLLSVLSSMAHASSGQEYYYSKLEKLINSAESQNKSKAVNLILQGQVTSPEVIIAERNCSLVITIQDGFVETVARSYMSDPVWNTLEYSSQEKIVTKITDWGVKHSEDIEKTGENEISLSNDYYKPLQLLKINFSNSGQIVSYTSTVLNKTVTCSFK
ncbi:hypothetical protein [Bdellovibrio sp. HCB-162]|uniref:hypothetical protein n=1 Tax=Bdellovibrio sp. HCB-162 TaxID=3394234 RepID=UPI0039BCF81F